MLFLLIIPWRFVEPDSDDSIFISSSAEITTVGTIMFSSSINSSISELIPSVKKKSKIKKSYLFLSSNSLALFTVSVNVSFTLPFRCSANIFDILESLLLREQLLNL